MIIRFTINYFKFKRVENLHKKYKDYLFSKKIEFAQFKEEIKDLFKEANLKDSTVSHQESIGFGKFTNANVSVIDNIMSNRQDIVGLINLKFHEAIGVFKKRYKESYNPIFWIDFIIKLPQYLMQFFGVLPEKIAVKILLIIYWLLVVFFGLKKFDLINFLIN